MKKKGAIELSIGTIVILVLAMSMLVLGLVLINAIFSSGTDVIKLTDAELKKKVSELLGDEKKLVVYPGSREIEIKSGDRGAFGIGIKNLLGGVQDDKKTFSYEVIVSDSDIERKCGVSEGEAERWISTGRSESNIQLAPGDFTSGRVLIEIPSGSDFCTFRYRINVKHGSDNYASELMDVVIKA